MINPMKNTFAIIFLVMLSICIFPLSVAAGGFDGSEPLLCAVTDAIECTPERGCEEVTPESINLPQFVRINVAQKKINRGAKRETNRTTEIENVEHIDGKLILQGADDGIEGVKDGLGWSVAIVESTGKFVLTGSGDLVGFVVFGACILLE
jgi:hypothetical protein